MAQLKGRAKCIPEDRNAIFLPFQSKWIKDESRLKLMEKSRQIGISWSTAYGADERAAAQGARFDEWVSSRDDIQARLFIEDCKLWAGIMGMAAKDLGEVVLDADKKLSAYVLQFASGRRIHSMSSNPDAQAGKRGSRILDEFAIHRDQRKMWAIAYPGITWGGNMEIVSTHRGSYSFFNNLVREARHGGNPKKLSLHRVTLQDALEQGFLFKLQQALPADAEQQVVFDRHFAEQLALFRHQRHAAPHHGLDRGPRDGVAAQRQAALRGQQAHDGVQQRGLAGAVGADQGDDFAGLHAQLHILQHRLSAEADANVLQANQRVAHAATWQLAHRPTISTVWLSTLKPTLAALRTMAALMSS